MAITQIIATLPAVLNDSKTFYEDIAIRNNSLVTVSFPSINTWATQANALAVEVNDKAAQVASQAVDGGYSQTYINTNFVGVNNAQNITGIKTFSANPISSAAQSSSVDALTRRDFVTTLDAQNIKLTGNQTVAGVKTFTSSPIVPTPTAPTQAVNKSYVDNSIDNLIDNLRFDKPTRRQPLFIKIDASSIKIPLGLSLVVGTTLIVLSSDYTLDLDLHLDTGTKTAGTDYYVYAKTNSTFYISANSTITADRLIGGFHYGLTTETEVISGNKTESDMVKLRGINSYTLWDLKYLSNAKAGNKGAFCNGVKWYDIYLSDTEYGINGYSRPFAQIAAGGTENGRGYPKIPLEFGGNGTVTYGKLTPFQAYDLAISAKKDLISYKEFTDIAYGVQEGLSQAEPVLGQNGHIPALTSRYGMELATGNQYIWSSEIGRSSIEAWSLITDSRGQVYANAYIALLGGYRSNAAGISGSRCSYWYDTLTASVWAYGSRCCSDLLILD